MHRILALTTLIIVISVDLTGCISKGGAASTTETTSLLGEPLVRPVLSDERAAVYRTNLANAQADFDANPDDEQAIIWLGRRTAYLGQYRDAVDIYTRGLKKHPDSYRLLRHRGHRYITLRKLDRAEADLSKAASLIQGVPDEVEPDGQPNRLNIPTSTSHTNIYYHLGLAHYLQAEYDDALDAYEKCMSFSKNDDMRVATAYWTYLTLLKLNRMDDANQRLEQITPDMNIIENTSYHRLLLAFKGDESVMNELQAALEGGGVDGGTSGYGLACLHRVRGDHAAADAMLRQVVDGDMWAAFGFIAAEAELAHAERR